MASTTRSCGGKLPGKIGGLVVDAGVKPQLLDSVGALLGAARNTNHATSQDRAADPHATDFNPEGETAVIQGRCACTSAHCGSTTVQGFMQTSIHSFASACPSLTQ